MSLSPPALSSSKVTAMNWQAVVDSLRHDVGNMRTNASKGMLDMPNERARVHQTATMLHSIADALQMGLNKSSKEHSVVGVSMRYRFRDHPNSEWMYSFLRPTGWTHIEALDANPPGK